ncbi:MAG: hypothetical protein PVJ15_09535 [Gammaproteobacteria bacterium]
MFHLLFRRLFHRDEDLRSLSRVHRAVMQVPDISLIQVFAIFAYVSLLHSGELPATAYGRSQLVLMTLF